MTRTGSDQGTVPVCDHCTRPSIYYDPAGGDHLCEVHLCQDIETRVISTITNYSMIHDGDRICVGLSGGKDSSALIVLLAAIIPGRWDAELVAVTIDEGISGYREDTIKSALSVIEGSDIRHEIRSFLSMYGMTLDTLLKSHPLKPCTACGILRRKALSDAARDTGSNIVATGHNLDDAAQSVLMNYLRGDLDRLVRSSDDNDNQGFIRRIKPFIEIPEKQVALYAMVRGIMTNLPECPYAGTSLRSDVRTMQASLEYHYPGASLRLVRGQHDLAQEVKKGTSRGKEMVRCPKCGEPCSGELCQSCRLLDKLAKNKRSM